jgi:hypothetical protein
MSYCCAEWVQGPFGPDAARAGMRPADRTALVVVHHMTAASRLTDIVPLLESDRRVQVIFTQAPTGICAGWLEEYLARLGAVVIPWHQATRITFDLSIAASNGHLEQLRSPVLTMPHGMSFNKYAIRWDGAGPVTAHREMYGMERATLVYRGRVIPSSIVVPTERDLARLRRACPEAASVAEVAGDPAYDRLQASLASRELYRQALHVGERTLVVVSSTWGPGSLLQRWPDLHARFVSELPSKSHLVAAIIHPGVWSWFGRRQVRAWFAESEQRGLILVPPEEGWQAALAAADVIVGDHGSVSCYGAAIDVPVLLASVPAEELHPASTAACLGRVAPRLRPGRPIAEQLASAFRAWSPERHQMIRGLVTDRPAQSGRLIRTIMYRLMNLSQPSVESVVQPAPMPSGW